MRGALAIGDDPDGEYSGLASVVIGSSYCCCGVCVVQREVPAGDLAGDPVYPDADGFPCLTHVGRACWRGKARNNGGEAGSEAAEAGAWVQAVRAAHSGIREHRQGHAVGWKPPGDST